MIGIIHFLTMGKADIAVQDMDVIAITVIMDQHQKVAAVVVQPLE